MKIRKNDKVLIISGKDKGRKGKVIEAFPSSGFVVVEGMNMIKKHIRPKKSGEKGQVVQLPSKINSSNVKVICKNCNKPTRIGYQISPGKGGKKVRICKNCGKEI
jgi:large subunit ribosomal protein L24